MYTPAAFRETRAALIEAAMKAHPLAALVTTGAAGIEASHIPLLYASSDGGAAVLRGHMARANPQWQSYLPESEALAIFSGPQHYVSPTWYPSTVEHGKVVPTWNYVVVHARGALRFHHEAEWLLENVSALTDEHEGAMNPRWSVGDAPAGYIANLIGAIVGVELTIASLEGKWKVSQNRPPADREGVIHGLQALASDDARRMARLVDREAEIQDH
jgi:transcriptional regulator